MSCHKCPICSKSFPCRVVENFLENNPVPTLTNESTVSCEITYKIKNAERIKFAKKLFDDCTEKKNPLCEECFNKLDNNISPHREEKTFMRWISRLDGDRKVRSIEYA